MAIALTLLLPLITDRIGSKSEIIALTLVIFNNNKASRAINVVYHKQMANDTGTWERGLYHVTITI